MNNRLVALCSRLQTGVLLWAAVFVLYLPAQVMAQDASVEPFHNETTVNNAMQNSAAAKKASSKSHEMSRLPAITVKAGRDGANDVRPHSTFNSEGERCIGRLLPFSGVPFGR